MMNLPKGKGDGNGDGRRDGRLAREMTLLSELIEICSGATDLFQAVARAYTYSARHTGAMLEGEKGRLSQHDGEMMVARLELQAEGLLGRVRKMREGWRGVDDLRRDR